MDPMEAIKGTFFQECEEQLAELESKTFFDALSGRSSEVAARASRRAIWTRCVSGWRVTCALPTEAVTIFKFLLTHCCSEASRPCPQRP